MTTCFAQRQITLLKIRNFHLNRGACFSPATLHFLKYTQKDKAHALPILKKLKQLEQAILLEFGEAEMKHMVTSMKRFTEIFVQIR